MAITQQTHEHEYEYDHIDGCGETAETCGACVGVARCVICGKFIEDEPWPF